MSIVSNIFCTECDSILDISKTIIKKVFDVDNTPSSMSEEEQKHKKETENLISCGFRLFYFKFLEEIDMSNTKELYSIVAGSIKTNLLFLISNNILSKVKSP